MDDALWGLEARLPEAYVPATAGRAIGWKLFLERMDGSGARRLIRVEVNATTWHSPHGSLKPAVRKEINSKGRTAVIAYLDTAEPPACLLVERGAITPVD